MSHELKYPMTCPAVPEVNVCGDEHTWYCPVHGLDLWYDTCWGCYDLVKCKKCIAYANSQSKRFSLRWLHRIKRIVGIRLTCVDSTTGKDYKLAAWAGTLPRAFRRFAAHARGIRFVGT